jgi:hypothetical protein
MAEISKEIYEQIIKKKDFSQLPKKDVERTFEKFAKRQVSDEEKIRLTRDLLRKVFSAFTSKKILSLKDKDPEWVLRKHISTRERLPYYEELYSKIVKPGESVFDLGAGINGFSYNYFSKGTEYIAVEAMGQLVDLMNYYFKTRGIEEAMAVQESLFELEKIKKYIGQVRGSKVVFLFKTLDSLEMLERDYSKRLLKEIVPLVDRVVVSFATRSLLKRTKFRVSRKWITGFIGENFDVIDDFELGSERYIVFKSKDRK